MPLRGQDVARHPVRRVEARAGHELAPHSLPRVDPRGRPGAARRARPRPGRHLPRRGERLGQVDAGRGRGDRLRALPGGRQHPQPALHPVHRVAARRRAAAGQRAPVPASGASSCAPRRCTAGTPTSRTSAATLAFHEMSHGESFLAVLESAVHRPGLLLPRRAGGGAVVLLDPGAGRDAPARRGAPAARCCARRTPPCSPPCRAPASSRPGAWGLRETAWEDLELVDHWRRYLAEPWAYLRHLQDD